MKYVVLLCDGMADYPLPELDGGTPMSRANKPHMEKLAQNGYVGLVKTVGDRFKPGSDVANLSVMGYDPELYYSGRSPLEAASIGIPLIPTDVALRCNLVTVSDEENYADKTILDYCADDISTEEARELITFLASHFDNEEFHLYPGVSYRHCLIWHNGTDDLGTLTPPHDITGRPVKGHLPEHPNAEKLFAMMKKSYDLLKDHPVNKKREERGLRPANSVWFWGEGRAKKLPSFYEKTGLHGAVISAVDLIKGIGKLTDMDVIEVEGATGYIDTNFDGKAAAAVKALQDGADFVYIHVEAPDECGHRHEIQNKVHALELIDQKILGPVLEALRQYPEYKVMILPDHATPLSLKTHTSDPVPFLIYKSTGSEQNNGVERFDEQHAKSTSVYVEPGHTIMSRFIEF